MLQEGGSVCVKYEEPEAPGGLGWAGGWMSGCGLGYRLVGGSVGGCL